ncbi:MAG: MtrB/PioB family decaheme-associated outer membrane protein [Acidobacteriota bacterium]
MNTSTFSRMILALVVAVLALPAFAEEEDGVVTDVFVDSTVGVKDITEDSSKAEEYGEIPEGFYVRKLRASFGWESSGRSLEFTGDNVGLNFGHYTLDYGKSGLYNLSVDYRKIPHLFSKDGITMWSELEPGRWRVADSIQKAIQDLNPYDPADPLYAGALQRQRAFISSMINTGHDQSLELMRDRGSIGLDVTPSAAWTYGFEYFRENRKGYRPLGTAFGFSWVTELPEHLDNNTQNMRADVQYAKNGTTLEAAYNVSLFRNDLDSIVWDNPYRYDDRTYSAAYSNGDGTSTGRAALPPDNAAHTLSFSAGKKLGSRSRLNGSFSYGIWKDDVTLLPFTINTSIETPDLPASTFKGDLRNISANVNFNTRFGSGGSFTAKYRLYDQSNKSSQYTWTEYVRFDQVIEEFPEEEEGGFENELRAFRTQDIDLDVGWELTDRLNLHAAYKFNRMGREHRDVAKADTNSFKTSLDAKAADWATIRFSYEYARRRFDEYELEGTYKVVHLYRFDEANLNRNLVRLLAQLSPNEKLSFGADASYGNDDYLATEFGLQKAERFNAGVDMSYSFAENALLNLWYDHTDIDMDQKGRQSGSTPSTDPRNDWTAGISDKFDTVGAGFVTDLKKDVVKWDINLRYAAADGKVDLFSPPGGTPDVAKSIPNAGITDLLSAKTSFAFALFKTAKLGLGYGFEKYTIDDYQENLIRADLLANVGTVSPGMTTLNAIQPDYQYQMGWVTLSYLW